MIRKSSIKKLLGLFIDKRDEPCNLFNVLLIEIGSYDNNYCITVSSLLEIRSLVVHTVT